MVVSLAVISHVERGTHSSTPYSLCQFDSLGTFLSLLNLQRGTLRLRRPKLGLNLWEPNVGISKMLVQLLEWMDLSRSPHYLIGDSKNLIGSIEQHT